VRAALIPPRGYESTALESDIHLVLPLPPLVDNQAYLETYAIARRRGHYIILDNGCAEGQLVDGDVLYSFAKLIGAHEIVAPDIMNNATATLDATKKWLKDFPDMIDYNIMGVVQGTTMTTREYVLSEYAKMDAITTVGIPKAAIEEPDSTARLELVETILEKYPDRFKIHLLGLSKHFPTEMMSLRYPEEVRSMDSAQPYKIAERGQVMSTAHPWAVRRANYFSRTKPVMDSLLAHNIEVFKNWAASNES
jgi:hypothetical protein